LGVDRRNRLQESIYRLGSQGSGRELQQVEERARPQNSSDEIQREHICSSNVYDVFGGARMKFEARYTGQEDGRTESRRIVLGETLP
jgi:hypothetical protein